MNDIMQLCGMYTPPPDVETSELDASAIVNASEGGSLHAVDDAAKDETKGSKISEISDDDDHNGKAEKSEEKRRLRHRFNNSKTKKETRSFTSLFRKKEKSSSSLDKSQDYDDEQSLQTVFTHYTDASRQTSKISEDDLALLSSDVVRTNNVAPIDPEHDKILKEMFPTATPIERQRFVSQRTFDRAIEKMEIFMKWREQYHLDDPTYVKAQATIVDDQECWDCVVSHMAKYNDPPIELTGPLPQIIRLLEAKSLSGHRIAHIIAAMLDQQLAPQEFYSACVAAYFDFKMDRDSLESIVVLIDVRGGIGWANPLAPSLVPFIKLSAKDLSNVMPERLATCIVFPLPYAVKILWFLVKGFLDSKHVQKIRILWGNTSASATSAAPVEKMKQYFDEETVHALEELRLSLFVHE
mmetsp:Transcript_20583/g.23310  ORF Transcript_20583/g.23310 Transcript_20583/m.23310 type:complete len:411 (+) Transcript_20583:270-1502(+)